MSSIPNWTPMTNRNRLLPRRLHLPRQPCLSPVRPQRRPRRRPTRLHRRIPRAATKRTSLQASSLLSRPSLTGFNRSCATRVHNSMNTNTESLCFLQHGETGGGARGAEEAVRRTVRFVQCDAQRRNGAVLQHLRFAFRLCSVK